MNRPDKAQLKAVFTSDLTADAMVVWSYLKFICPAGAGSVGLSKVFDKGGVDWREGADILLELGMIKTKEGRHGVRYQALAVAISRKGTLEDIPVPVAASQARGLLDRFQLWRESKGFNTWVLSMNDARRFEDLGAWLVANSVDYGEYLEFCWNLYKPIKQVACPAPHHLTGPFAQSHWQNRTTIGPSAPTGAKEHAGAKYRPAKAVKARLKAAGISVIGMDSSQLRYVEDLADAVRLDPDTPVPDRWQEAVSALIGVTYAAQA